jgi:uncharacterized protein
LPRVVLDASVLISALISPHGIPAELVRRWLAGWFELVVSERLLREVERAAARPKIRHRASSHERRELLELIRSQAVLIEDPTDIDPVVAADPADDYLFALARAAGALAIVSGDRHLTELRGVNPRVLTPRGLLVLLESLG